MIILVNDDFSQLQEEESGVFKQGGMWSSFKGTRCADFSSLLMCSLFTSYKITGAQSHTFKSIQNMVLFCQSLCSFLFESESPLMLFPLTGFHSI